MCDHHQLRPQHQHPIAGEINDVNMLSEHVGRLFLNEDYSDVTLRVENCKFQAHKVVLAARSEYFRALLYGGMIESRPECHEIELKDTNSSAFHYLLKYIYTGRINLMEMKEEILLDILGLTHQYGFVELEASISDYLKAVLNIRNVCLIYDIASVYSLRSLSRTCCEFIDHNASDIIHSDAFFNLSPLALQEVISRDSFYAPEIDIFRAVQTWASRNPETRSGQSPNIMTEIMKRVRMQLIELGDLLDIVRSSSLVCPDAILDAIKVKNQCRSMDLNYRGMLLPEENVATGRHNAQVTRGEMKSALLDGDTTTYDQDRGFSRHPIDENHGNGIMVELGKPCIINTIHLLLWDKDVRNLDTISLNQSISPCLTTSYTEEYKSYSYYIEVSVDDQDWFRVVDHTNYHCRSWQYLHFPAQVVKYIRVVGTHNTVNRVFHLVSLECMHTAKPFSLDNGIIRPRENVATINMGACVTEGVSRTRNALINGDMKNYDWDSGYTCHQLGSGAIVIQLAQPYLIDSCRLLLWDCDGRSYSYYIEVSVNNQQWTTVTDKTKESCKSWQTITFKPRPVAFIKIVGTYNTANEVFHCVHFECPANNDVLYRALSTDSPPGGGGGPTNPPEHYQPPSPPVHVAPPSLPPAQPHVNPPNQALPPPAPPIQAPPSNDGDSNSTCSNVSHPGSHPGSQQQTSRHSADIAISRIMTSKTFNLCRSVLPSGTESMKPSTSSRNRQFDYDNDNAPLGEFESEMFSSNHPSGGAAGSSYSAMGGACAREPVPSTSKATPQGMMAENSNPLDPRGIHELDLEPRGGRSHSRNVPSEGGLLNRTTGAVGTNGNDPEQGQAGSPGHHSNPPAGEPPFYDLHPDDNPSGAGGAGGGGASGTGSGTANGRNQHGASG